MIRTFLCVLAAMIYSVALASPFGKNPKTESVAISPDGTNLAFIDNVDGKTSLMIASVDSPDQRKKVIDLEEKVQLMWLKWVNNERVFVAVRANLIDNKVPFVIEYILNQHVDSTEQDVLFHPTRRVRQFNANVINFLPDEKDHVLFSIADLKMMKHPNNKIAYEVRKINVATDKYDVIEPHDENVQKWMTDLTGQVRVAQGIPWSQRTLSSPEYRLRIFDLGSQSWTDSSAYNGLTGSTNVIGFTENPNELIVSRYGGYDTLGLQIYDLKKKEWGKTLYRNNKYDVSAVIYSADGTKVIGATYIADRAVRVLFDDENATIASSAANNVGEFIDQSKDGRYVIREISGATKPGHFILIDKQSGQSKIIGSQYPDISAEDLGKVVSVEYSARDGQSIPGYVTLPKGVGALSELSSHPFIVLPHGGPNARDFERFDYLSQSFANRGYGVLQMNFRGSSGYGQSFANQGLDDWGLMEKDVSDGAKWLIAQGYADPSKVCVGGWSFGGYAALMAKIQNPDLYACTFSIAGITDLETLIRDMKEYLFGKAAVSKSVYRAFEDKSARDNGSPSHRYEELSGPVFLAHGDLDDRVHYEHFKKLSKKLKKNKTVELTTLGFKEENHFFENEENRLEMLTGLHEFLDKALN